MPLASSDSLYITTIPDAAGIAATPAVFGTVSLGAGQTRVITGTWFYEARNTMIYVVYPGQTSTTGVMLDLRDFTVGSDNLSIGRPLDTAATIYYSNHYGPAFVMPNCRGAVVNNNSANTLYIRRGRPNASGITIGKPGDANSDEVQGIPIPAGGSYTVLPDAVRAGEHWYLLAEAAGQTATVLFQ